MKGQTDRPAGSNRAGLAARQAAAQVIDRVVSHGETLDRLFDERGGSAAWRGLIPMDRALARAIATVALRHRGQIQCALAALWDRNPPAKARHLLATLHAAAAQILFMDVPDRAAVDLAVTSLREDPRSSRFAAFGNAVLRRLSSEREAVLEGCSDWQLAFAPWLARRIRTDHGKAKAAAIAQTALRAPPLDLTLAPKLRADERGELVTQLGGTVLETGSVRLESAGPVDKLPGYAQGWWWVQDAAAALPARLLGDVAGRTIADLCAAPGGKTAQLAAAGARVVAVDQSSARLARLRANLERLKLEAECVQADVLAWEPGHSFDGVLLDAPCSATGTLRRHPDVGWNRGEAQVDALAALQAALLEKAARLVGPDGIVVFANCSLLKQEGEDLVAGFLARHPEFVLVPLREGEIAGADRFINGQGALRTLPSDQPARGVSSGMDGFYAARLKRLR